MTLTDVQQWVRDTDHLLEEDFIRLGRHLLGPIRTGRSPEYSERLRNLVRDCLNPKIASRPTASTLVTRTRAGVETYRTTSRTGTDTTNPPFLRHLNRSKSVLSVGQAAPKPEADAGPIHSPVNPPSISLIGVNRKASSWEPRRSSKRARTEAHEEPPIIISSDTGDVLPKQLPPTIRNEREGKRRRRVATHEDSVRGSSEMIRNIAGEVIVISDDTDTASRDRHHTQVVENEEEGDGVGPRGSNLSNDCSGNARCRSVRAKHGSSLGHPETPLDHQEPNWLMATVLSSATRGSP